MRRIGDGRRVGVEMWTVVWAAEGGRCGCEEGGGGGRGGVGDGLWLVMDRCYGSIQSEMQ